MSFRAPVRERCYVCEKTVYEQEKIKVDEKSFHKGCFRCKECNCVIKPGNYAALEGQYFCKAHFKQLFKLKGNYSEGFGKQKHSALWLDDSPEGASRRRAMTAGAAGSASLESPSNSAPSSPLAERRADASPLISSKLAKFDSATAAPAEAQCDKAEGHCEKAEGEAHCQSHCKKDAAKAHCDKEAGHCEKAEEAHCDSHCEKNASATNGEHHEGDEELGEDGRPRASTTPGGRLVSRDSMRDLANQGEFKPISERYKEVKS